MAVKEAVAQKRAKVGGPMCLGTVFASAGQMRKLATNDIGGKDVVRGKWRTDKG